VGAAGSGTRETVPDGILRQAAEIVAVDVTPGALLNRLKRGTVYKTDMAERCRPDFCCMFLYSRVQ